jgi:hypothetical protein
MEAVHTSETSVDNHITRQYIPEDNSEHHTRRRENLKSHKVKLYFYYNFVIKELNHPLLENLKDQFGPAGSHAQKDLCPRGLK